MDNYIADLHNFIKSGYGNNAWLHYPEFSVYIRKSVRRLPEVDGLLHLLDVANVSVREDLRGQGIFSYWLSLMEVEAKELGLDGIYVENLLNRRLGLWLKRRGYTATGPLDLRSYYRLA